MDHKEENEVFTFSYSATEQEEIKNIRSKYVPSEEYKLEQLRRLDASVTKKGTVVSLILGIISTLIMGGGMSCCMVGDHTLFIPGIIIGLVGIAGIALAYPIYAYITQKEQERLAPEILRLTDELMK